MAKRPTFNRDAARLRLQDTDAAAPAAPAAPAAVRPQIHPAHAVEGPRTATDHILLDPNDIVLSGPYVRQHVSEAEIEELREAITASGEVKQAIGVRLEGPPLEPRYVLVYGMRRWLASKRAGLTRIPARNHGRISLAEALAMQVAENEARLNPHPVDTAISYELLGREGKRNREIAAIAARSDAHVSYMRKAGEALLALEETERRALYERVEVTVPFFQDIAPLPLEGRLAALRNLLVADAGPVRPVPSRSQRARAASPLTVHAGPTRQKDGWSITVRYREQEVRRDAGLRTQLRAFLEEQLRRLEALEEPDRD